MAVPVRALAARALAPLLTLLVLLCWRLDGAGANYPLFDVATRMRVLLVPRDAAVGSVIYRLRATDSDFDYPLHFDVGGEGAGAQASVVRIDTLPCSRNMSYCQANVILARRLDVDRVYDVRLRVRDSRGDSTSIDAIVQATNSTTPLDVIFPRRPALIMVPEDTPPGTELDYVIVRKNPKNNRYAVVELWGSSLFSLTQRLSSRSETNASIILAAPLDYESQAMYSLEVYALDAYAEPGLDTRNVAAIQVALVVVDVQDTPPEFTDAPPVTQLDPNLKEGDEVVRVKAEDGDKGKPRQIRYGLVSEGSPFTTFFTIDERNGVIRLARPLSELAAIARPQQPILLTVMAEEVRTSLSEPPAMASTATLALLLGPAANSPPYFDHPNYVTRLPENSPQGAPLVFGDPYTTVVRDDDMGKNGVFSLSLENNNGTFEVLPAVAEQRATFVLHVRSAQLLDYEMNKVLSFRVVARELTPDKALSASAEIMVFIDDVNDNPPHFLEEEYHATLPENVTAGTRVVQVTATDVDTGEFGHVRYTAILGRLNTSLALDPESGSITIATDRHGFDREVAPEFRLDVEARDENGAGLRSTVPLLIRVLDVNDETPVFEREPYELILAPDRASFSSPAFIKATDRDAEPPNNQVRYEILSGNVGDHFELDRETGEVLVKSPLSPSDSVITINVRAYDLGVPLRWTHGIVRVYPPETRARTMTFIVPGNRLDPRATEEMLNQLTGGRVTIKDIKPYDGDDGLPGSGPKSQVTATVLYNSQSVIDVASLQKRLKDNRTAIVVNETVREYRAENAVLFWVLVLMGVLLGLALLSALLCCCCCRQCPLYIHPRKGSRVHSAENVQLVVHEPAAGTETKGVQAGWIGRLQEAWSSHGSDDHHVDRRRGGPVESAVPGGHGHAAPRVVLERASHHGSHRGSGTSSQRHTPSHQQPVMVVPIDASALSNTMVLTRRVNESQQLFVEDVDGAEYRVLDPSRFVYTRREGGHLHAPQHQNTRHPPPLHQHHQHHLTTQRLHDPHVVGMEDAMGQESRSVHEDIDTDSLRRHEAERGSDQADDDEYRAAAQSYQSSRQPLFLRDGDAEILRLVTRGGSPDDPLQQSQHLQSQRAGGDLRPYTLVDAVDHRQQEHHQQQQQGKDIIMRRFMEDQQQQVGDDGVTRATGQQDMLLGHMSALGALQNHTSLVQHFLEQRDMERRDSLLHRFLAEEGRRNAEARQRIIAALDQQDTQSLPPGHLTTTMATQTDVDSSTQTDPLHLFRPPPREVRSDNDSLSSEDDNYSSHNETTAYDDERWSRRRNAFRRSHRRHRSRGHHRRRKDLLRHIKTPILEENESSFEAADLARTRVMQVDQLSQTDSHVEVQVDPLELEPVKTLVHASVGRSSEEGYDILDNTAEDILADPDSLEEQEVPASLLGEREIRQQLERQQAVGSPLPEQLYLDMATITAVKVAVTEAVKELVAEKIRTPSPGIEIIAASVQNELDEGQVSELRGSQEALAGDNSSDLDQSMDRLTVEQAYTGRKSRPRGAHQATRASRAGSEPRERNANAENEESRRRAVSTGRVNSYGSQIKYVRGNTYMSWYKKKREEREKKKAEEAEAKRNVESQRVKRSKALPRTNRATEVRRAKAADTVRRLDEESRKAEENRRVDEKEDVKKTRQELRKTYIDQPRPHIDDVGRSAIFQDTGRRIPLTEVGRRVSDEDTIRRLHEEGVLSVPSPRRAPNNVLAPVLPATSVPLTDGVKAVVFDDDLDSGIAMSSLQRAGRKRNQQLMEKKSIFTIAYDEMHTQHIRTDSATPPH